MKLIDRYISRQFIWGFLLFITAFIVVFLVVDIVENVDHFIDRKANFGDVALYYIYFLPYIFVLVSPIGLLLAANFSCGAMARHREVIALKNAGMSPLRIALPIFIFAIIWSILIMFFGEVVVPPAVRARDEVKKVRIDRSVNRGKRIVNNIYFVGDKGEVWYIKRFDGRNNTGNDVSIVFFDDSLRVIKRIDGRRIKWNGRKFVMEKATERLFAGMEGESTRFIESYEIFNSPNPEELTRRRVSPDQMDFFELWRFIEQAIKSGYDPVKAKVNLYMKISYPFSNFIIVLLAVPIALHLRKTGTGLAFGISFIVSFIYFAIVRTGQSLGYNETLSPLIAANAGNIVFLLLGLWGLYRYRY